ncbi:hypothetical protein K1719_023383 [Acacia pycnantha]|nr:hypothetical protein K1719_023383 [Acacia pycnantha]
MSFLRRYMYHLIRDNIVQGLNSWRHRELNSDSGTGNLRATKEAGDIQEGDGGVDRVIGRDRKKNVSWLSSRVKGDSGELGKSVAWLSLETQRWYTKKEDLSMEEIFGLSTPKKLPLEAVAEPRLASHLY